MRRTYYTFAEIIEDVMGTFPINLLYGEILKVSNENYLLNFVKESADGVVLSNDSPVTKDLSNELFCRYIAPRFRTMFALYTTADELTVEDIQGWVSKFILILNATYDKYAKIIETFRTEKANLMDAVKVVSQSRFNDTPQNNQGVISFDTDPYTTDIRTNEVSNELSTKMQRLAEINGLLENYFRTWSNEFGGLFIYD